MHLLEDRLKHEHLHFKEIDSTHSYALSKGLELPDKTVITSDFQTAGRGRLGRRWISPPGESLLVSIILKPKISASEAPLITPILALATSKLLDSYDISTSIRWPNDVVVKYKKIAGILAEAGLCGDKLSYIVASMGLNVNQDNDILSRVDRPATSIYNETGRLFVPSTILPPILREFKTLYDVFLSRGFTAIADDWRKRMSLKGEDVLIDMGEKVMEGRVTGFGNDGSIEIRDHAGHARRFRSGEVARLGRKG